MALPHLSSGDELVRFRAAEIAGRAGAELANKDLEAGRDFLRRMMWSLNDESGNFSPGAAAAMAEAMFHHQVLAREFAHVLVSFITPGGLFLDHPELQKAALWGLGRLVRKRGELFDSAEERVAAFLDSRELSLQGLALWTLAGFERPLHRDRLYSFLEDERKVAIYKDWRFEDYELKELAHKALGGEW